jgi:predicted O-methyltransferase YrrM
MDHHSHVIGMLASIYKPNVYVELGLYHGETFVKVQPYARKLYGIDITPNTHIESLKRFPNVNIHYCTTDLFFDNFSEKIDMAFIDADHCIESAKRDFDNVLSRLSPGGVILLHDTDPETEDLIRPDRCGDSYKIVTMLEDNPNVNILTLPLTNAGLSIVTKKNGTRTARRHLLSKA